LKRIAVALALALLVWILWSSQPSMVSARQASPLLAQISPQDALLVVAPDGQILYKQNHTKPYAPASTLKILTALAAIHYLGESYRFDTEFYLGSRHDLKIKGYGDPLLVSEVWQEMAEALAPQVQGCQDLILDDTYFAPNIVIPGVNHSTNPYDAPNGALCANFNTVFFKRDKTGSIVSAEPQTPMTPLALKRVGQLGLKDGRHNLFADNRQAALYAGEILIYFLRKTGRDFQGGIRFGAVHSEDKLLYVYRSPFTMKTVLQKMLEFSNNFIANQVFLALGAHVYGPPGTVEKGVRVVSQYAKEVLQLRDIQLVEGSGISRKNRLSPLAMLAVLKAFAPHRGLLTAKGPVLYKSGTLKGLKTRVGYIENRQGGPYYFVFFLNSPRVDIDALTDHLVRSLGQGVND
jgi:D-alanyl-D-alanine carboxypeptidase/D-alanyl-D-alanine-endopeptidase (penicillin-binding protein 4)